MIAIAVVLTAAAKIDAAAPDFGTTGGDVVHCPFVTGQHALAVLFLVCRATGPEYFSQLRHGLQIIHEAVNNFSRLVLDDFREMGIDSRSTRRVVAEIFLNKP